MPPGGACSACWCPWLCTGRSTWLPHGSISTGICSIRPCRLHCATGLAGGGGRISCAADCITWRTTLHARSEITSAAGPALSALASLAIVLLLILSLPVIAAARLLALVVPKKKNLILLMPRFGGAMNGNLKYFFLYLLQHHHGRDCEVYLIARR